MANTIYATFLDAHKAEKAAGALLDHGVAADDISLIANEKYHEKWSSRTEQETFGDRDYPRADEPQGASTGLPHTQGVVPDHGLAAGPYSGSIGAFAPLELGAMGTVGPYAEEHASGYDSAYEGARRSDFERPDAKLPPTKSMDEPSPRHEVSPVDQTGQGAIYESEHSDQYADEPDDIENAAKKGITTTTAGDAGSGAMKGAGIGLGVGAAAALVSLLVPGVGLVFGGGALAAALGGMAATAGAGAIAGGVFGYLKDQGVEDHHAKEYAGAVDNGGALLEVRLHGDTDEHEVRELIDKYGASAVRAHAGPGRGYAL